MENQPLVSMAQQFTGLPMNSLIGGPLNAAATANSAMALSQTKFMLDTCFQRIPITPSGTTTTTTTGSGGGADQQYNYTPIMINMTLKRGVLTPTPSGTAIQEVDTTFNLPLLTIVPINSLAVDEVDITFEMEVKSSFSDEQTQEQKTQIKAEASFEAKAGWGPLSVSIKGSASYDHQDSSTHSTHYQKSNSAKYTVKVHAGQLPLPKGVNTIIEAYTNAIQPITMPEASGGTSTTTT